MLLFAALVLASTPGLAGHAHHMHGHDVSGVSEAHAARHDNGSAPAAAICVQLAAGSTATLVAAAPDEHRHHPCGSHDTACKRISSCVSCVSAIASTFAAMPLPDTVRALRKAPDAIILAGLPPAKLQRPPRRVS